MPVRDDVLREMGLAPRWRLRAPRRSDATGAPPAVESPVRSSAEHGPVVVAGTAEPRDAMPPPAGDERARRIAALDWTTFADDVAACTACALCRTRNRAVPGVGDVRAQWLFVGEAPGAEEDAKGEPFVGQAGRLLDNMLAALGLDRHHDVYIANVLKCRPPNNRTPGDDEASACRPYLERQIDLVRPRVIVALGKSAASLLLATDASIGSLRGRVHRYRGIPLVVTYHPAYLLRTLPDKVKAWEDLLLARRTLATPAS